MSKIDISSSSPSAPGTSSLTRSPNNTLKLSHASTVPCVFARSSSHFWPVWVSLVGHNPPDGHNCYSSSLCFCFGDLLVEFDFLHPTNLLHLSCAHQFTWKLCSSVVVELIRPLGRCIFLEIENFQRPRKHRPDSTTGMYLLSCVHYLLLAARASNAQIKNATSRPSLPSVGWVGGTKRDKDQKRLIQSYIVGSVAWNALSLRDCTLPAPSQTQTRQHYRYVLAVMCSLPSFGGAGIKCSNQECHVPAFPRTLTGNSHLQVLQGSGN